MVYATTVYASDQYCRSFQQEKEQEQRIQQ